jgi:hypothetical protein
MFCGAPHHFFSKSDPKKEQELSSDALIPPAPLVESYFLCPSCRLYKSLSYNTTCGDCKKDDLESSGKKSSKQSLNKHDGASSIITSNRLDDMATKYNQENKKISSGKEGRTLYLGAVIILSVLLWTVKGQPLAGFSLGLSSLLFGWVSAMAVVLVTNTRHQFFPITFGLSVVFCIYFSTFNVDGRVVYLPSKEEEMELQFQEAVDEYCDTSDC